MTCSDQTVSLSPGSWKFSAQFCGFFIQASANCVHNLFHPLKFYFKLTSLTRVSVKPEPNTSLLACGLWYKVLANALVKLNVVRLVSSERRSRQPYWKYTRRTGSTVTALQQQRGRDICRVRFGVTNCNFVMGWKK